MMRFSGFVGLLLVLFCVSTQAETVAEKLGYPADAKLVIIHGDDVGMCHSANTSAADALEKGIVTSGSIMIPCPWFLEAAEYCHKNPEADLGLHLTLTSEWKHYRWRPVAALPLVKGLVDDEGCMHDDVRSVYANTSVKEAEAEVRAQIEYALSCGIQPTHMDSHMGTLYYNPEYLQMALRLSEEYDIPLMFFKANQEFLEKIGPYNKDVLVQASKEMELRGIPLLDSLPEIGKTSIDGMEAAYKELFRNIKPGLSLVILHLADESKEYKAITGSYPKRLQEYRIFTDPKMKEFIEKQDIILIGWKELLPLWKQREPLK